MIGAGELRVRRAEIWLLPNHLGRVALWPFAARPFDAEPHLLVVCLVLADDGVRTPFGHDDPIGRYLCRCHPGALWGLIGFNAKYKVVNSADVPRPHYGAAASHHAEHRCRERSSHSLSVNPVRCYRQRSGCAGRAVWARPPVRHPTELPRAHSLVEQQAGALALAHASSADHKRRSVPRSSDGRKGCIRRELARLAIRQAGCGAVVHGRARRDCARDGSEHVPGNKPSLYGATGLTLRGPPAVLKRFHEHDRAGCLANTDCRHRDRHAHAVSIDRLARGLSHPRRETR